MPNIITSTARVSPSNNWVGAISGPCTVTALRAVAEGLSNVSIRFYRSSSPAAILLYLMEMKANTNLNLRLPALNLVAGDDLRIYSSGSGLVKWTIESATIAGVYGGSARSTTIRKVAAAERGTWIQLLNNNGSLHGFVICNKSSREASVSARFRAVSGGATSSIFSDERIPPFGTSRLILPDLKITSDQYIDINSSTCSDWLISGII